MSLCELPVDILVLLPEHLHNVEDFISLASACRTLRHAMNSATPNTIFRLLAAQSGVFFRPSPHFLVAAVAKQLSNWARQSDHNESKLVSHMQHGLDGLLELALEFCGLSMDRVRQLHHMRFDIVNPVTNIIDQCVGEQWYGLPNFWNGGADDAYTIDAEPPETLLHLVIYGELFGKDFETYLDQDMTTRRLSVATRLEFVKYCIPDFATHVGVGHSCELPDGSIDPRRAVQKKSGGPYDPKSEVHMRQNNIALTWLIKSSRWRPRWRAVREQAGVEEFVSDFEPGWWTDEDNTDEDWRQRLMETVMICQGLEGLGIILPDSLPSWGPSIQAWRKKIANLQQPPRNVYVGRQATHDYPFLLGDLRICASGYVPGS